MVNVMALCASGSQNGGIRDGRDVVAADCTCKAGCNRDGKHLVCTENADSNRNQNAERTPGSTGCKCKTECNEEEQCGHEQTDGRLRIHKTSNETAQVEVIIRTDTRQRPCKGQNGDCGNHCLEASGEGLAELAEGQDAAGNVHQEGEYQCGKGAENQCVGGRAVCECVGNRLEGQLVDTAARVDHSRDAGNDQEQDGDDEVLNRTRTTDDRGFLAGRIDFAALQNLLVVLAHRHKVNVCDHQPENECQRQQCVEVEGDGAQEQGKAIDACVLGQGGGDGSCPAGDRCDDAHGSCGCIDDVGQLCAGNLVLIGNRTHNCTDGQAVEVVVDEDEHAEERGRQQRAAAALDDVGCPFAVGAGRARLGHEGYQDAQHDQEDQDANVVADFAAHDRECGLGRVQRVAATK